MKNKKVVLNFGGEQHELNTKTANDSDSLGESLLTCRCGWEGSVEDLKITGCLTHGDEWYACPECGGDSSKRTAKHKAS